MSYNLDEQDQIEQLRAFWQRWGTWISAVLLVAALAWAGYGGWHWWSRRQAAQASNLYSQLSQQLTSGAPGQAAPLWDKLRSGYASTAYAQMASLALARSYVDARDQAQAVPVLQWASSHGPVAAQRAAAMLDLAALQIDAGKYQQALQTLAKPPTPSFDALFLERRGDVYAAQGKRAQARREYSKALAGLPAQAALSQLLRIKLDSVGGAA